MVFVPIVSATIFPGSWNFGTAIERIECVTNETFEKDSQIRFKQTAACAKWRARIASRIQGLESNARKYAIMEKVYQLLTSAVYEREQPLVQCPSRFAVKARPLKLALQ